MRLTKRTIFICPPEKIQFQVSPSKKSIFFIFSEKEKSPLPQGWSSLRKREPHFLPPLFLSSNTSLEAGPRLHPPSRLPWQRYLGPPRPEAEGHPGQQYNSGTARVPGGLRPERRDLAGGRGGGGWDCRLREQILSRLKIPPLHTNTIRVSLLLQSLEAPDQYVYCFLLR